jgi:hypothetical protein
MADPNLSRQQIARDDLMKYLAANPGEALRRWKRLRPGEDVKVITLMAMSYGLDFAQEFRKETLRRGPKRDVITVTDSPDLTPQKLASMGYKFQGTWGSTIQMQIWIHPTGKEMWCFPRSNVATTQKAPSVDPLVDQARLWADESVAGKDRLTAMAQQLRHSVGSPGYAALSARFWSAFNKWQEDLNWLREEGVGPLKDEVNPADRAAVQEQLDRLNQLDQWKRADFVNLVRDLPPR